MTSISLPTTGILQTVSDGVLWVAVRVTHTTEIVREYSDEICPHHSSGSPDVTRTQTNNWYRALMCVL